MTANRNEADASIIEAERRVVDAAKEWANNIDHRDADLLTALRVQVRNLELLERAAAAYFRGEIAP